MNPDSVEIITLEQFADKMQIARTTAFEWKRNGKLLAGRDFVQIGRVIRILWGAELLKRLLESTAETESEKVAERSKPKAKIVKPPKQKTAINFAY